ncbi:winged helix DNA-binding domain-containing protein [Nonomuraea sp. NBC_01738]|nr:winged helix DNA-binding domain-containing protein [Nonomuraea sp. NBC_01738]
MTSSAANLGACRTTRRRRPPHDRARHPGAQPRHARQATAARPGRPARPRRRRAPGRAAGAGAAGAVRRVVVEGGRVRPRCARRAADRAGGGAHASHAAYGPPGHRGRRAGLAGAPRPDAAPAGARRLSQGAGRGRSRRAQGGRPRRDGRRRATHDERAGPRGGRPLAGGGAAPARRAAGRRPHPDGATAAARPVACQGGVRNALLATWLGREADPPPPAGAGSGADPVGEALVRRYLAAYGPAATADLRAWCGLAGLPAAVSAIRGELVAFRDERGRELLDLPGAPRPDPDVPAPVRFLPAFDNAILGYHDRGRVIDDEHRGLSVAGIRVVLVDGRVSATWTVEEGRVAVTPLRAFSRAERAAVAEEGEALSVFLAGEASVVSPVGQE